MQLDSLDYAGAGTMIKDDQSLLEDVLSVYFKNTRYLKFAEVRKTGDPSCSGKVSARCQFSIPVSCYISNTGHFNSVEFNICYNQMMYYLVAISVKHKLLDSLSNWSLDTFRNKQLADILIVKFQSSFKRPVEFRQFYGEIDFIKTKLIKQKSPMLFIKSHCRFYDDNEGFCMGEVDLAVLNP